MSTKKSGGKSSGSNGTAGKSGGGSQGSLGKSTPKPCSQGMSCGKPSSSVDTKSVRSTQETVKTSLSKGNISAVKLQDAAPGKVADPQKVGQKGEGDLFVAREAAVPAAEVKVKSSDLKSRGVGRDTTKQKLTDPNSRPKARASAQ